MPGRLQSRGRAVDPDEDAGKDALSGITDLQHSWSVGSHGQGRLRGIILGSTATELIHKAPCSVLVARKAGPDFPRRIVAGVDGSPQLAAAYAVARHLSERFSAELWPVVAHGGTDEPVPAAIVSAAADADLVVVGSRGLHGLKALGSVSKRVAHRAHCSTLVVREGVSTSGA